MLKRVEFNTNFLHIMQKTNSPFVLLVRQFFVNILLIHT